MAQVHEEIIAIKVSTLVKDSEKGESFVTDDMIDTLEEAVAALVGDGHIVEVIKN